MASARSVVIVSLVVVCVACGGQAMPSTAAPGDSSPAGIADSDALPTAAPGNLYVNASEQLGAISPLVYGTNYGPWSFVPLDLQAQAEAAGITYLRFPGGNWGDQHNLRPFHIDPFIELCRKMGAEPSISVRLEGGTPEQAADVVRYVNRERGYGVRYWSIGNEPSLYDGYDVERYNAEWRLFADAMLAVDPSISLVGPDLHQYSSDFATDPKDSAGNDWMRGFLTANGDLVDVVSIHRYPFPESLADATTTIADLRANSREWDEIIPHLRAVVAEATGRALPVAVTEINTHWSSAVGGEATPDSFYAAIWWGDVLGRLIRQRVEIVAHFTLYSKNSIGGWGLLGQSEARPAYYVYRLYQRFGNQLVYASSGDSDLSIYAALTDDDALTLVVINLGQEEKNCGLEIDGFSPRDVQAWRFDADQQVEPIGIHSLADRITVPRQSMTLYMLES